MKNKMIKLKHSEDYTEKLVRLPFYFEIDEHKVVDSVIKISL